MRRWPCRYQTFYLKPFMRRCGGHSRRLLFANAAIAASRLANEHKREDCHRRDLQDGKKTAHTSAGNWPGTSSWFVMAPY
jgi:hypothetical protein